MARHFGGSERAKRNLARTALKVTPKAERTQLYPLRLVIDYLGNQDVLECGHRVQVAQR